MKIHLWKCGDATYFLLPTACYCKTEDGEGIVFGFLRYRMSVKLR